MKRRYLLIVILDLLICGLLFLCFNHSTMYYCGRLDKKPRLAFDLSPTWYDDNFTIAKEYKDIISSADRTETEPFYDKWVKGSELFKTILAYDAGRNEAGVLFKALNWEGAEQVFLLRELAPWDKKWDEEYAYEVTAKKNMDGDPNPKWVSVSKFSCLTGGYQTLAFLILVIAVILNIIMLLKLLFKSILWVVHSCFRR
jgi:hypothetical protein